MTAGFSIDRKEAVLVVVDVQERLAAVMDERQKVIANCRRLVEGAAILEVPAIVTERSTKCANHPGQRAVAVSVFVPFRVQ